MGALLALFTLFAWSCTRLDEFEQKLDMLETRIKVLEAEVTIFNDNVKALQKIAEGSTINNVVEKDGVYTITCSNGEVLVINQGSIGVGNAPILSIDEAGYWMADYGDGPVYILDASGNKVKALGTDGMTPYFGVDSDGNWTVKFGDSEPQLIKGPDGEPVCALPDGEVIGDLFFSDVTYDQSAQLLVVTIKNGESYSIPVIPSFLCSIQGGDGIQIFRDGESKTYSVELKGVVKTYITVPHGWNAYLSEPAANDMASLTVYAPASVKSEHSPSADTRSDLAILALSSQGYATVAKMTLSVEGTQLPEITPGAIVSFVGSTENTIEYSVSLTDATGYRYIVQEASSEAPSVAKLVSEGEVGPTDGNLIISELTSGAQYTLYVLPLNGDLTGAIVSVTESTQMGDVADDLYAAYLNGEDLIFGGQVINKATFGEANLVMNGEKIDKAGVSFIDSEAIMYGPVKNGGPRVVIIGRYAGKRSVVKYSTVCYLNGTAADDDLFVMANIDYRLDGTAQKYQFHNEVSDNFETLVFDNCRLEIPENSKFIQTNGSKEIENILVSNCECEVAGGTEPWFVYTGAGDALNLTVKNSIFWNSSEYGISGFQLLYTKDKNIGTLLVDHNTFVKVDSGSKGYICANADNVEISDATVTNNLFYLPDLTAGYRNIIKTAVVKEQEYKENAAFVALDAKAGVQFNPIPDDQEQVRTNRKGINPFDPAAGGTYDLVNGFFVPTVIDGSDYTIYGATR